MKEIVSISGGRTFQAEGTANTKVQSWKNIKEANGAGRKGIRVNVRGDGDREGADDAGHWGSL